ncbi:hypothetical protein X975_20907, partial [Stegodyphus mimosarum]
MDSSSTQNIYVYVYHNKLQGVAISGNLCLDTRLRYNSIAFVYGFLSTGLCSSFACEYVH